MSGPVDPDSVPEGTRVDCWRVVRPLGGGAYGSVYLVEKDGELYALKMARFLGNSGDARRTDERAQRELHCLLSLHHPHIAQVRSYGRWPHTKTGFFYVVMDCVEGYTLAEWAERTHPTPHEVVALFDKMLSAVAYTHAQGILHRDLKPTNILVEAKTGEPVVVDFGAAYFPMPAPQLTDTRLPPGTPRYTSPEARRFESIHRYDTQAHYEYKVADELFALGVTLYDVLTDPLHHTRPQPQLMSPMGLPAAQEVNARVPLLLSRFTAKLVEREPAHRPVSAEAARRELAELLLVQSDEWRKRPVHAPVPPPSEAVEEEPLLPAHALHTPSLPESSSSPPRPRRRSRAMAVGGMVLVLGLLVAWGVSLGVLRGTAAEAPASAPSSATAPMPHPPLPPPPAAPPTSTLEKGTSVNIRQSPQASVPTLCAQTQPPPHSSPQWLRWCKCAAIVGSVAAAQAGCPAVQVRQSITEECSQESVNAMLLMEVDFDEDMTVELDVKQPNRTKWSCDWEGLVMGSREGPATMACIPEGLLTSRVLRGSGKLVRGTLLAGQIFFHQRSVSPPSPILRWTEATLPDGTKHPVCIEMLGTEDTCPNGAYAECAAQEVQFAKRWRLPLNP